MQLLFAAVLVLLGAVLAVWAWCAGGLPRTAVDRAVEVCLTADQRVAFDLTLAFAVMALGILAAAR